MYIDSVYLYDGTWHVQRTHGGSSVVSSQRRSALCPRSVGCLFAVVLASGILSTNSAQAAVWPLPAVLTSLAPAVQSASIFGTDDRRIVNNTTTFPWSAIGQVQLGNGGSDVYVGTAVMIGRYLALTCGHVAADPALGAFKQIKFFPGLTRTSEPFGQATVVQVIPSPQWKADQDDGYDIAILVMDRPIGDETGYFRIAVQPDTFFDNQPLETAGYPTDLGGADMYTVSGNSMGMEGNVLFHDLDTEPGQSGSPMWYGDAATGQARLIGLDEGSYLTATLGGVIDRGIAARIDQSVADWINEQLAANGDILQDPTVPDSPVTTTPTVGTMGPTDTSMCGQGVVPFLTLGAAGWGACQVSRRRRWQ